MAHPESVSDATFQSEVLEATGPVLVDFWASWCAPCKAIAPLVEELAQEYDGKLTVRKLDVDANPTTAGSYGVMSIPTLLFFKDGVVVERLIGFKPNSELHAITDALISGAPASH